MRHILSLVLFLLIAAEPTTRQSADGIAFPAAPATRPFTAFVRPVGTRIGDVPEHVGNRVFSVTSDVPVVQAWLDTAKRDHVEYAEYQFVAGAVGPSQFAFVHLDANGLVDRLLLVFSDLRPLEAQSLLSTWKTVAIDDKRPDAPRQLLINHVTLVAQFVGTHSWTETMVTAAVVNQGGGSMFIQKNGRTNGDMTGTTVTPGSKATVTRSFAAAIELGFPQPKAATNGLRQPSNSPAGR